ncbi:hypothetical protein GCM10007415_40000 [Parapedobacter pyrenivorans]|uniref:Uncharacterized protein n=2 Tax=Parapedobacter pyrenivorans TaxID=1305674 RepID=A0A917I0S4_9SPHI|nr:hypothetical protein GCM10007415_40000 [Parapedobacter pyrenivorans]
MGALAYVGLVWANETIYRYAKIYQMIDMTWYRKLWLQSAVPLLISAVCYHMTIFPMLLSFQERPDSPIEIAAKHWAFVHFPVMLLFSVMLLLLAKAVKPLVAEEKIDEMLSSIQKDIVELEHFRKKFSDESFLSRFREALPLMWKEGMEKYLGIAPDAFTRPIHQIPDPYIFRVLPPYGYKAMLARVNSLVKTGHITIRDVPDFEDGTYLEMAYKSRNVRFRHPEAVATINEMMGELSLLLMPDYQLRHCKLLSEPEHAYQWMACLQPAQWRELEAEYGSEKMDLYFGRVDRNYQAGKQPDQKTKEAALELFKMDIKFSDSSK